MKRRKGVGRRMLRSRLKELGRKARGGWKGELRGCLGERVGD